MSYNIITNGIIILSQSDAIARCPAAECGAVLERYDDNEISVSSLEGPEGFIYTYSSFCFLVF